MKNAVLDGYQNLLRAVFKKPPLRYCGKCGCLIGGLINQRNLCLDCYRKHNRENARRYYQKYPDRVKRNIHRWQLVHREAVNAWGNAHFHFPKLQLCQVEGCFRMGHRHHPDYNKPHEIIWLCPLHHREWHDSKLKFARSCYN